MANYEGVLSDHIEDSYGIAGQTPVNVLIPDTATLAQIATDVAGFASAVGGVSQGRSTKVTLKLTFPGTLGSPLGDIEKGGLFNFANATDIYATGVLIPDIAPGVLNAAGLIDLTNGNITALIAWLTTTHTVITVTTKGVRALTALIDALISFRKHRKPLERKTKEI